MESIVKDNQLDYELQELYSISSHWNSDISFVQDEIRFLKNALNKYDACSKNLQVNEADHFCKILEKHKATALSVRAKIAVFLKFVELFIIDPKKEMGLDMLEKFNVLGTEIESISEHVKLIKKLVFAFIEDAIKAGKYTETPVVKNPIPVKTKKSIIYML